MNIKYEVCKSGLIFDHYITCMFRYWLRIVGLDFDCSKWPSSLSIGPTASMMVSKSLYYRNDDLH